MAQKSRLIGPISAYAIAVAKGYQGTESEFAEQVAKCEAAAEKCEELTASLPDDFTEVLDEIAAAEAVNASTQPVTGQDDGVDLDVIDTSGNVILRIQDGYIKTKKVDTTDPYELPDYYTEGGYLDGKIERINEIMKATGGDAFMFCTDQHMLYNSKNSYKLIRNIYKRCRINKLFMGGDLLNGVWEPFAKLFRDAMDGRAYFMAGNHDYMNGPTTDENIAWSLQSGVDDEVSGDYLRRYYWVDNPKQKIRYIVTNSFMTNESHTSWVWGFEEAQMTWLTEEAMNVPEGWGCVIFSHMFWASESESYAGITLPGDGTGNPWDGDFKAVLDAIDAANTNGQVLCIVQGHTHQDAVRATDGGIPILITTADRHNYDNGDEPYMDCRVPGTTKEQAIDVCILDRTNGKLYAVRVGGYNTGDSEEEAELEAAGERVLEW